MTSFATRHRLWSVITLLIVGLMLSELNPPAAASQQATPAVSPGSPALQWEPCDDVADAECAWLEVPIDPAQPEGAHLNLRLARLPALDPEQSLGSLLIIPGGPGVGITAAGGQFGVLRPIFHLDELRKTFDVVTYDPRGIGQSSPIRCTPMPLPDVSTAARDGVMSAAELAELARANAAFAESCFAETGELMEHLSARDAAADIERIRQALGQDDGLVAYAGSYGTLYATAYLEEYGDHVKALVLDGVVDHSIDLPPYGVRWILSTEDAFSRFGQWCAEDPSCALHGQDVAAVFDTVIAAHPEVRPMVRARLSAGRTPGLGWPVIAETLAALASGESPAASPEPEASPVAPDPALLSGELGLFRGVLCADFGPQDDDAALAADNALLARQAPHFAWLYSLELPGSCAGWPREAANPPHRLQVGSHPNVLVANPTHDPATPLVAAVAVWSQIPQARLLIADTDGHQSLPFSRCAFETQVQFLSDPSSLPTTTFCPAEDPLGTPDQSTVTLNPNDCAFLIQGSNDPRERLGDIACGTLDVPENWSDPEGRRIQIVYLVLKSTATQPAPDPVVFLAGGPGSSPLTSGEIWAGFFAGLRQERDVVFFDQRGTRLSSPLRCEASTRRMALVLPPDEDDSAGPPAPPLHPAEITNPDELLQRAREQYGPAAEACARQLTAQGVDLSQYTTAASANDAVALVKALGYDEYNLYGISYGTRLALEVMRNHPESGLRSVVLDSTYPPEIKTYEQLSVSTHEVAMQLFADCARDPACHAAYPDLEQRFVALLARLRAEPVVADDGTPITDRDLINVMHSLTSRVEIVPYVPLLISELERGEDATYRGLTSGSLFAITDASATPQIAAAAEATPDTTALADLSAARHFVLDLRTQLESLPGAEADQFPPLLIELDALAHDRQTLRERIDRAFPRPEQAKIRATFLSAIGAMSDADVQEVFAVVAQTITLEDAKIAGQTVAQYYSIECNERMPYQSFANTVSNAQQLAIPDLALGKPEALAKVFAICERWPSGRAPASEGEPVWSETPTLILSGAYDNLTPVSWNTSAFTTLPNGIFVLAPMSGHAVITYSTCAEQVAQAFIADPDEAPDTSCLAALEPRWVLPPADEAAS